MNRQQPSSPDPSLMRPPNTRVRRRFDRLRKFLAEEDGPTAVEYAVMLAMIVGACVATVRVMSNATAASFDNTASQISDAFGGGS